MQQQVQNVPIGLVLIATSFLASPTVSAQSIALTERADFDLVRGMPDGHFHLANDIDFGPDAFEPIGSVDAPFTGVLDGRRHSLSNLYIEGLCDPGPITFQNLGEFTGEENRGLFAVTDGATILDLELRDVRVSGYLMVGSFVGRAQRTHIERCAATGVVLGNEQVGGLVGYLGDGHVFQCWTDVEVDFCPLPEPVHLGKWTGGLIGHAHPFRLPGRGPDSEGDGSIILHSYTLGSTRGRQVVGGVIGNLHGSTADHCFAIGNVEATQGFSGGFAGYLQVEPGIGKNPEPVPTVATHCHAHGMVTAVENPAFLGGPVDGQAGTTTNGGFIGYIEGGLDPASGLPLQDIARSAARGDCETLEQTAGLTMPTGGFVGFTETETLVRRSFANGSLSALAHQSAGGFVGWGEGLIVDSTAHGDVIANNRCGGFGGQIAGTQGGVGDGPPGPFDGAFERCASYGDSRAISADFQDVGGVAGFAGYLFAFVRIEDCEAHGSAETLDGWGGGFVGHMAAATIERCASFGPVRSNGNHCGGFGARTRLADGTEIRDCYSHSTVIANGASSIGGFLGSAMATAMIERCYSKGLVISNAGNVGGFVGSANSLLTFADCYWDRESSGQEGPPEPGRTPATTEEMQQKATYSGWDFLSTWGIREGKSYPFLFAR